MDRQEKSVQSTSEQKENWRPVPGFAGYYEVSDRGRVRSLNRTTCNGRRWGRLLKPYGDRFPSVRLSRGGKSRKVYIRPLVFDVFGKDLA